MSVDTFVACMTETKIMIGTLEERLWAKIDKREFKECWLWTASCNSNGYGQIPATDGLGPVLAHRVVYDGSIPTGMNVLHRCDNPPCCNPAHLWLGTQIENIADMNGKGRNGNAGRKMTAEAIAKRKMTCLRNNSHEKRWETRCRNNPDWLLAARESAARARAVIERGESK